MTRYATADFKELIRIQNAHYPHVDIVTITGFMDDIQFLAHVARYRAEVAAK
jgi:hypothetical protein